MPMVREILKRVKKIDITTHNLVEGLIAGSYRSVFKGRGVEFSEVREYVPGDDIRTIDWNVTARFNTPYVKEFIEERNLDIYIAFDVSSSNNFGYRKSKKEVGYEIAASLMFAALKNNDNVGLCLFTDRVEKLIKPMKGRKFFLRLLREMIYFEPKSKKTDIKKALIYLSRIIKKRSVIFVISDFFSGSFEKPLKFLKNRNDVILINIRDFREEEIPDIGYVFLEDEETGEQILVDTGDEKFRRIYIQRMKNINNELASKMKKIRVDVINVSTNEPFYIPLRKFFKVRERRGW